MRSWQSISHFFFKKNGCLLSGAGQDVVFHSDGKSKGAKNPLLQATAHSIFCISSFLISKSICEFAVLLAKICFPWARQTRMQKEKKGPPPSNQSHNAFTECHFETHFVSPTCLLFPYFCIFVLFLPRDKKKSFYLFRKMRSSPLRST